MKQMKIYKIEDIMIEIPTPSKEEVEKYIAEWNTLENYVNQENSLNKLF